MQLSAMEALVSQRLNEAAAPVFYPQSEIASALNEADRLFCLMTLALETTATWTPVSTFTHMLTVFPDWIVPLRITSQNGQKIRPCRIQDLWALDPAWPLSPGPTTRYASIGLDLVAVYPQFSALNVTYAQAPLPMANATDTPQTPPEYHPAYVSYAIYRLRQAEGGAVLAGVMPLFTEFLDAATEYADFMRARHVGAGYDTTPPEFALWDRSAIDQKAKVTP